jgi:hypothetical protein
VFDNRRFFDFETLDSRIRGEFHQGRPVIPLGTIDGMQDGTAFDIFKDDIESVERLGTMEADARNMTPRKSYLRFFPNKVFKVPDPFFATQVGFLGGFACFCEDKRLGAALERESVNHVPGLKVRCKGEETCDISVIMKKKKEVAIVRSNARNRPHRVAGLTLSDNFEHCVPATANGSRNLGEICRILHAAACFYGHLTRQGPEKSNVTLELLYLEEDLDGVSVPRGTVAIQNQQAIVKLNHSIEDNGRASGPVGLSITNSLNQFDLHPYVFYFNPSNLKIGQSRSQN